jgi:hypothetical protein
LGGGSILLVGLVLAFVFAIDSAIGGLIGAIIA